MRVEAQQRTEEDERREAARPAKEAEQRHLSEERQKMEEEEEERIETERIAKEERRAKAIQERRNKGWEARAARVKEVMQRREAEEERRKIQRLAKEEQETKKANPEAARKEEEAKKSNTEAARKEALRLAKEEEGRRAAEKDRKEALRLAQERREVERIAREAERERKQADWLAEEERRAKAEAEKREAERRAKEERRVAREKQRAKEEEESRVEAETQRRQEEAREKEEEKRAKEEEERQRADRLAEEERRRVQVDAQRRETERHAKEEEERRRAAEQQRAQEEVERMEGERREREEEERRGKAEERKREGGSCCEVEENARVKVGIAKEEEEEEEEERRVAGAAEREEEQEEQEMQQEQEEQAQAQEGEDAGAAGALEKEEEATRDETEEEAGAEEEGDEEGRGGCGSPELVGSLPAALPPHPPLPPPPPPRSLLAPVPHRAPPPGGLLATLQQSVLEQQQQAREAAQRLERMREGMQEQAQMRLKAEEAKRVLEEAQEKWREKEQAWNLREKELERKVEELTKQLEAERSHHTPPDKARKRKQPDPPVHIKTEMTSEEVRVKVDEQSDQLAALVRPYRQLLAPVSRLFAGQDISDSLDPRAFSDGQAWPGEQQVLSFEEGEAGTRLKRTKQEAEQKIDPKESCCGGGSVGCGLGQRRALVVEGGGLASMHKHKQSETRRQLRVTLQQMEGNRRRGEAEQQLSGKVQVFEIGHEDERAELRGQWGLRAATRLEAGDVIGLCAGLCMLEEETTLWRGLWRQTFMMGVELRQQGGRTVDLCIDAWQRGNQLMFLNDFRADPLHLNQHQPPLPDGVANAVFVNITWRGWPYVAVVALSDVNDQDELLIDYGAEYWQNLRNQDGLRSTLGQLADVSRTLTGASRGVHEAAPCVVVEEEATMSACTVDAHQHKDGAVLLDSDSEGSTRDHDHDAAPGAELPSITAGASEDIVEPRVTRSSREGEVPESGADPDGWGRTRLRQRRGR